MIKKKNGFTLVEMIATLVLMIALGVLITSNVVGMLGNQSEKDYENFKDKIESSACTYAITHNINTGKIAISELVKAGLVDEDLKNPSTNEVVDQRIQIEITMVNKVRKCTYPE